jgi:hypothetical protein
MTDIPFIAVGTPLLSIEDQPASCNPHCLCNATPNHITSGDGYASRWTPTPKDTP